MVFVKLLIISGDINLDEVHVCRERYKIIPQVLLNGPAIDTGVRSLGWCFFPTEEACYISIYRSEIGGTAGIRVSPTIIAVPLNSNYSVSSRQPKGFESELCV